MSHGAENICAGCPYNCKYCCAKAWALFYKKIEPRQWLAHKLLRPIHPISDYRKPPNSTGKTILYPSTHDITMKHYIYHLIKIRNMIYSGNKVLVISKANSRVIRNLCDSLLSMKQSVSFMFTIGSVHSKTLKFWEPGAPTFEQRFKALSMHMKEVIQLQYLAHQCLMHILLI